MNDLNIDKKLLDKQILDLLEIRFHNIEITHEQGTSIDGIIELLESIQDKL